MNLEQLYRDHSHKLRGFIHRRFGGKVDADDVVQEAFTRLKNRSLSDIDRPENFLYIMAANIARDMTRREKSRRLYVETEGQDTGQSVNSLVPERFVLAREEVHWLSKAVAGLPRKQRQAFLLIKIEGLSYKDAAKRMDISVNTIERHMVKALSICRKAMKTYRNIGDGA